MDHSLHTLSYGMRQKVAIASAQAIEPEIYVMDEPSANLDIESTYRFGDIIRNLKAQGKTIVIAEHRLYYLMDVADRFFCIQHGAIVREFSKGRNEEPPIGRSAYAWLADAGPLSNGVSADAIGRHRRSSAGDAGAP